MSVIVDIDHETGDLSQYTATTTDSGDLSVAAGAALASTAYGLSVLIDDTTAIYGRYTMGTPDTSGILRMRFYIDPNTLTMANTDRFTIVILDMYNGSGYDSIGSVDLYYTNANQYQMRAGLVQDTGTGIYSSYYVITDAPHYIEIQLLRATGSSANDGSIQLWIDGTSKETVSGKDNYDRFANFGRISFGATGGIDAGTSGTFYLDELVVNDDGSEIGPVSEATNTQLTVADSSHAHAAESKALEVSASLAVADTAHAHAAEAPALGVSASLAVADASHAHAADNITVLTTGQTTLTVQDATHAHTAESKTLEVSAALVVADASHAHSTDGVVLTQNYILSVADALHAHAADGVVLNAVLYLIIADALHAHYADQVTFPGGAGAGGTGIRRGMKLGIEREMVTE